MSIAGFAVRRPVPVNILMGVLLVAGLASGLTLTREFFPESTPDSARVTLVYPGATPEEIEQSMVRKIEDALIDLDEVEMLTTTIAEGGGGILVEFRDGVGDVSKATDELERAIDALRDLPEESERIQVTEFEPRLPVISVNLFGRTDEETLKLAINRVRDDLQSLSGMGELILSGVRDYEIRVDVSADALIEHGVSLPDIADLVSAWMAEVPGGTVRTTTGNVNVRTMGVDRRAENIRRIVVMSTSDGQFLRLGDIATVRESYVDALIRTRFATRDAEGPSASLTVYKVGDQDAVRIARMVRAYARGRMAAAGYEGNDFEPRALDRLAAILSGFRRSSSGSNDGDAGRTATTEHQKAYELGLNASWPLPPGVRMAISSDLARFIEGRLDLLMRNAKFGAVLVFATLLIFLNWRTALWVGVGLTTAVCGTLLFMQITGTTLNLLTMFGLIVVLGLLVDDAIVVAENIQSRHDAGEPALVAAVGGTEQVFWPVVATVLTSIVAFLPLTFVKGQMGDLLGALPWVVACALVMSLIESLLILPSHMGHSLKARDRHAQGSGMHPLRRFERRRDRLILEGLVPAYARLLARALRFRYVTLAIALGTLIVSFGVPAGGRLLFEFIPASDSETIIIEVEMPVGASIEETERAVERLEAAAAGQPEVMSITTLVGVQANVDDTSGVTQAGLGTHLGQLFVELTPVEDRDRESGVVIASIRDAIGTIDGVESLAFREIQGGPAGEDITIQVSGEDEAEVRTVVVEVKRLLATMDGVYDIGDDDTAGQREVQIELRPGAAALGFTVENVARQVRGALFGIEAHVFSAHREDIEVRVRLDEASRRSLFAIEHLWLISPRGKRVPLQEIAILREGSSYNTIHRVDRRRATSVTAETAPDVSPEVVVPALMPEFEELERLYPGTKIALAGRQRQFRKAFQSLPIGFLAALSMIYVILAWLFGSYLQPLAVMLAIPFGMIGVIWGHIIMGYDLTFLSIIGFVALSGIVVNDSLILVEFYNERRAAGDELVEGLIAAGRKRLRPILLTTITTVLGLTPLMLERSFQAKFLIPMAISISFGLMSATALILLVLPCILVIIDDFKRAAYFLWYGLPRPTGLEPTMAPEEIEGG